MKGAAPKAIQELVGHSTLSMTLRYMHLAPSALAEAIGLLDFAQPVGSALSAAFEVGNISGEGGIQTLGTFPLRSVQAPVRTTEMSA
jgi:hypothetical protein